MLKRTSFKLKDKRNKSDFCLFELFLPPISNFVAFSKFSFPFSLQDVGRCVPIHKTYYGLLVNGICHDIVSPFNGLWSGLGLVLFFFIPGLFLICCLDNIFRREKRRPKYSNPGQLLLGNTKQGKIQLIIEIPLFLVFNRQLV